MPVGSFSWVENSLTWLYTPTPQLHGMILGDEMTDGKAKAILEQNPDRNCEHRVVGSVQPLPQSGTTLE